MDMRVGMDTMIRTGMGIIVVTAIRVRSGRRKIYRTNRSRVFDGEPLFFGLPCSISNLRPFSGHDPCLGIDGADQLLQ